MRRWLALTSFVLLSSAVVPASAFVTPRWNAARESRRNTLLGKWAAVSLKVHKQAQKIDDTGLYVVFTPTELRVEEGNHIKKASWKIVRQENDLLVLDVTDEKERHISLDVLVEGTNALTLYLANDDGDDDDESIRLERVH